MTWLRKNIWLVLTLLLTVYLGRNLLTSAHFYTHDDIAVFRVNEFLECFKNGQIPCRWSYNLGKGYGAPWFHYYPPAIYLLPSALHLIGLPITLSVNLFVFSTFLLAGLSMYYLVHSLTEKEELAFLSASLYSLYPFHAINIFIRGVWAENLAWSFAPLILLSIFNQVKSGKFSRSLPLLFALLFLTHIISSMVLTLLSLFWLASLVVIYKKPRLKNLARFVIQLLIGLGIAAFFFIPALVEKNLVQSATLTQGYYHYTNHYLSFNQLFLEYKWNYGASLWSAAPDEMPFMVGHIHTIVLVILLSFVVFSRKFSSRIALALALLIPTFGFLFLSHFKSDFIWSLLPQMAYIQFPWRFVVWAGLPLVASIALFASVIPRKLTQLIVIPIVLFAFIYSSSFFFPRGYDDYLDQDFISGSELHEQQSKTLYDYMPITVSSVPEEFADESDDPYKTFYFPGWHAYDQEGSEIKIHPNELTGLIEPVDPSQEIASLDWQETPFRLAMDYLSIIVLISYLYYLSRLSHVQ